MANMNRNSVLKKSATTIFLCCVIMEVTAQTLFEESPQLTIADYWNFGHALPNSSPFGQFRGGHTTIDSDPVGQTSWRPSTRQLVQTVYDDDDVDRQYPTSIIVADDDDQDDQGQGWKSSSSYLTPPEPEQPKRQKDGHIYDYRHYDQIAYGDPAGLLTWPKGQRQLEERLRPAAKKETDRLPGTTIVTRVRGSIQNKKNYLRSRGKTSSYGNFKIAQQQRVRGNFVDDVKIIGNLDTMRQLTRNLAKGRRPQSSFEPLTKIDMGQAMEELNSICGHTMYFFRHQEFGFLCARKFRERMLQLMKK